MKASAIACKKVGAFSRLWRDSRTPKSYRLDSTDFKNRGEIKPIGRSLLESLVEKGGVARRQAAGGRLANKFVAIPICRRGLRERDG
jgi:hypothetical protein